MPVLGEYSEVAICNMALGELGRGGAITSLDENSESARAVKLRYPYARDAVLRAYDWNFATARKSLPKNAAAPDFDYANAFDLPDDCLKVRSIHKGDAYRWIIEGRQILTDMGDPLPVIYTKRVTECPKFDPLFVAALATRIASDICLQLTESASRTQQLWQVYQSKLIEARRIDAQEGQADSFPPGDWVGSRGSGDFTPYRDWRGE